MAEGRKLVGIAAAALCLMALLVSCAAGKASDAEKIRYALGRAGGAALDRAFEEAVPDRIARLRCLPPAFRLPQKTRAQVPGLDHLVGKWVDGAREVCGGMVGFLKETLSAALGSLELDDPAGMLRSDTSVTTKLREDRRPQVEELVLDELERRLAGSSSFKAALASFKAALDQYNNWMRATAFLEGGTAEPLALDPLPFLARELADMAFHELGAAESAVRTTPGLELDRTCAEVFGLDL